MTRARVVCTPERLPLLKGWEGSQTGGWDGSGRGVGEGGNFWFLSDAGEDGDGRHFAVGWGGGI